MEPSQDPIQELIAIEKQNQALLQELLINQTILLEGEQERKKADKRRIWIQIAKYIFWGAVIIWSFVFTQKLIQGFMGGITGQNSSSEISLPGVLNGMLKGGVDPDTQKELERYLGK